MALDHHDIREMRYFLELRDAFRYPGGTCFCADCLAMFDDRRFFLKCLKVLAGEEKVTKKLMQQFTDDDDRQGFVKLLCLKQATGG